MFKRDTKQEQDMDLSARIELKLLEHPPVVRVKAHLLLSRAVIDSLSPSCSSKQTQSEARKPGQASSTFIYSWEMLYYMFEALPRLLWHELCVLNRWGASSGEDLRPHGQRRLVVLELVVPVQPRLQPGNSQSEEDLQ